MVMGSPQKIAVQNATHSTEWKATFKNIQGINELYMTIGAYLLTIL